MHVVEKAVSRRIVSVCESCGPNAVPLAVLLCPTIIASHNLVHTTASLSLGKDVGGVCAEIVKSFATLFVLTSYTLWLKVLGPKLSRKNKLDRIQIYCING